MPTTPRVPQAGGAFLPSGDYDLTGDVRASNLTMTGGSVAGNQTTTANVGTVAGATITAVERGNGVIHQTILTLTNVPVALVDAHVGGGSKIYTFPEGRIAVLDAIASVAETTTSALAGTLNASAVLSAGIGSVQTTTQDSGTLATTQQDIVNAFAVTASAVVNVAGAAATGKITATTLLRYDGTGTAQAVYLNAGVVTATDIDADATTTWSGTVTITWIYGGDL